MRKIIMFLIITLVNVSCGLITTPEEWEREHENDPCSKRLVVFVDGKEVYARNGISCSFGRCEFTGEDGKTYTSSEIFPYEYRDTCK